ncbi:MAG: DUF4019 domain-containing protein [Pyrinomonadaceae bacterium]
MRKQGIGVRGRGLGRSLLRSPAARRSLLFAFCLALFISLSGCAFESHRSGLPPGAQAAIDDLTEQIAAGQFSQVYEGASDEWRATVSAEESEKILARVRDRLGRVQSRVPVSATEQAQGQAGHALLISYDTKFERADAVESFTLVERGGRWLLARYAVNSDALKP